MMPRACPVESHVGRYTLPSSIKTGCHGLPRGGFTFAANSSKREDSTGQARGISTLGLVLGVANEREDSTGQARGIQSQRNERETPCQPMSDC